LSKKKTHEEFIQQIKEIDTNIEIISEYNGRLIPVKCRCKIDGYTWDTTPASLIRNKSHCFECSKKKQTRTHEDFLSEMAKLHPNIEVMDKYINSLTPINFRCKIDNFVWVTTPSKLINCNRGCPKCARSKNHNHKCYKYNRDIKGRTHEEFLTIMAEKHPNIEVLGKYQNTHSKIELKCKIDGHIWSAIPLSLLRGSGCPKCYGHIKKTHEQYVQDLKRVTETIVPLEVYKNSSSKLLHKCLVCGHVWRVVPNSLLQGYGCLKCGGKLKKTHEQFVEKIRLINSNIDIIGIYQRDKDPIKCKCKIDGYEWNPLASNLVKGQGCPLCSGRITARGYNDLWTSNQQLAKMLLDPSDGYSNTQQSNRKVWWKCPHCGMELEKKVADVYKGGLSCPRCSDHISYFNKFAFAMLEQIGINFDTEYSPDWIKPKKYDFHFIVKEQEYILEMDGEQHFNHVFNGTPLTKIQEYDTYKNEMALKRNIQVIRIDCRNKSCIVQNMCNSELKNIFNLEIVDWRKCHQQALTSKKAKFYNHCKQGCNLTDIITQIHIHKSTAYRWLRLAYQYGILSKDSIIK
jgi:predicted  nucleic acid-binding Zn-ribbon protein